MDRPFARRLYAAWQGHGIRCWIEEKQLRHGDDILDRVAQGVQLWDKVLLCCTQQSLTSWRADNEIAIALDKERQLWSAYFVVSAVTNSFCCNDTRCCLKIRTVKRACVYLPSGQIMQT